MEEEVGYGWLELVHADDRERCLREYSTAFDERSDFQLEYRLQRFDGEHRWLLDIGTPRRDAFGNFAGYIGSCIDISDRKYAEEEREAMLQRETSARAEPSARLG